MHLFGCYMQQLYNRVAIGRIFDFMKQLDRIHIPVIKQYLVISI
jgi:hypothetical protein